MSHSGYKENTRSFKTTKRTDFGERVSTQTVEDVLKFPILEIIERGIEKKTAEHFGVRTELSSKDGITPVAHYFPYTEDAKGIDGKTEKRVIGYKKRDLTMHKKEERHFQHIGVMKTDVVDLFGTDCANSSGGKKVVVTEGEYDCMGTWQVMKKQYPGYNPSVLSIGFGAPSAVKHIGNSKITKFLKKFNETILAFDNDRATIAEKGKGMMKGNEATSAVVSLLPDCLVAQLPDGQDPCDMMQDAGGDTQLYWSIMKAIKHTPDGFITYGEYAEEAKTLPVLGKPWPWKSLTKLTLGRRLGETLFISAGIKCGKSEFANKLIQHILDNDVNAAGNPQKVALFKLEETPSVTCAKVAGKMYCKDFSNPEKVLYGDGTEESPFKDVWGEPVFNTDSFFDQDDLSEAMDVVGPRLIMYNAYGSCRWDELKMAIRHAVIVEGVEDVIIDPISKVVAGLSASEANQALEIFADELSKMAKDLGFTAYCFCHLKNPEKGPSHEFGGKIASNQFTGSRAMGRSCYYMMGIERNKDSELSPKEFNTSHLVILDDRKYGRTGRIPLFYDKDTGDYQEPPAGFLEDETCQTLEEWNMRDMEGVTNPELAECAF